MRRPSISGLFWRFAVAAAGCAALGGCAPKEAADPHEMLEEDLQQASDPPEGAQGRAKDSGPPPELASRAECEAAARRVQEVALELAVQDAPEDQRAEIEARRQQELKSQAFAQRVSDGTRACLQRETSRRDAQCVARAKTEADIDGCGSGN